MMNNLIKLTIYFKLENLKRKSNPNLTFEIIEEILYKYIWKNSRPKNISTIVNDIMALDLETIVRYMSMSAVVDGYEKNLSDFEDILGGRRK